MVIIRYSECVLTRLTLVSSYLEYHDEKEDSDEIS